MRNNTLNVLYFHQKSHLDGRKTQIIRLLLKLHEVYFFISFLTHCKWFFMKNKILGRSKRISVSFLLNVFCFTLPNIFQSNLILPNDNFETFLFNRYILELSLEHFQSWSISFYKIGVSYCIISWFITSTVFCTFFQSVQSSRSSLL